MKKLICLISLMLIIVVCLSNIGISANNKSPSPVEKQKVVKIANDANVTIQPSPVILSSDYSNAVNNDMRIKEVALPISKTKPVSEFKINWASSTMNLWALNNMVNGGANYCILKTESMVNFSSLNNQACKDITRGVLTRHILKYPLFV